MVELQPRRELLVLLLGCLVDEHFGSHLDLQPVEALKHLEKVHFNLVEDGQPLHHLREGPLLVLGVVVLVGEVCMELLQAIFFFVLALIEY